jgi:hypothetical protein
MSRNIAFIRVTLLVYYLGSLHQGHLHGLLARVLDGLCRLLGVLFFLLEVGDEYVCALAGEGESDRARPIPESPPVMMAAFPSSRTCPW